jgi:type II restriction enzyme
LENGRLNLRMHPKCAAGFKSPSQVARKVTEAWAAANLYCMACESDAVTRLSCNVEAVDFSCERCSAAYQLKAMRKWSERRVPDAGYDAMMRALRSDTVPNLLIMQYDDRWLVCNLLLIPSFFFSPAAVQRRKPLGPTARRAGWVGCNILLHEIADEGKIRVVSRGIPESPQVVRNRYDSLRPLANVHARTRGWTLDVLRMVRRIGRDHFCLHDVYAYEDDLSAIYPDNRNVRAKIRQQLQVLRDLGFLAFEGGGRYRTLR